MAESQLQLLIAKHIPVEPSQLRFERIPTGKFNTSYFVEGAGRPLVLRIAPPDDAGFVFYERGMMAQEPEIHRIIREQTSAPVAEILAYDNSRELIDRDFLIMEKLPGRPMSDLGGLSRDASDRVLYQVGRALHEIHSITATSYGYIGAHRPMEPQPGWNSAFIFMWNAMIDDIAATGCYDQADCSHMRGLLDRHVNHFSRNTPSMLLHMDIWEQNILMDDEGNLTGLIDFDRAVWGDPEIEFAVLDYCSISKPAFWEGYGEERDNSPSARIRTLFYLLYEIQKYIVIRYHRYQDIPAAMRYKAQVMRLAEGLT